MSKDWMYLCQYNLYFYIYLFWYDILCQHEFDGHPVHTVMQTSMWPHCVLTAWGLWTPFRVSSDLQILCKDTLNNVPQAGLLLDISKNHEYHMALFENKKELKHLG